MEDLIPKVQQITPKEPLGTRSVSRTPSLVSMSSSVDLFLKQETLVGETTQGEDIGTGSGRWKRCKKNISTRWTQLWSFLKSPRFIQEVLRTSIALIVFVAVTAIMMMAQMFSDEWFDQYTKSLAISSLKMKSMALFREVFATDPLYDRVFRIIPDWEHLRGTLPDALLTTYIVSFAIFNVIWIHRKRIQYQGLVVLRRFLWIMSCLYIFRTMTFLVTTVPNPIHNCVPKYAQTDTFEAYINVIKDMASGRVSACTDNIYSGHTTLTFVILFSFWMYSGKLILQLYALVHAFFIIAAILITRLHYTVDVLIAMFMSAFVFLTFHFLLTVMLDDKLLEIAVLDVPTGARQCLESERIALHRVYKKHINHAVWWIDGFDLRLKSAEEVAQADMVEIDEAVEEIEEDVPEAISKPASPTIHKV